MISSSIELETKNEFTLEYVILDIRDVDFSFAHAVENALLTVVTQIAAFFGL